MDTVELNSPTCVRLQNRRFLESYLHELPQLPEVHDAPFGGMICRIQPGEATDPDFHNQSELFVVVAGSGTLISAGQTVDIHEGEAFSLPPKVEHVIENTGDTVLTFVSVWWPRTEPTP